MFLLILRKHLLLPLLPSGHNASASSLAPILLLLLLFGTSPQFCDSEGHHQLSYSDCLLLERRSSSFSTSASKVVSVREGHPAYLHCPRQKHPRRKDLKTAWTRLSDDALLAVDTATFTQDPRFQVSKPRKEESDWVLILRRPGPEDQGCYLCEVNTEPTSTLVPVYLKVILGEESSAEEKGPDEWRTREELEEEEPKLITRLQSRMDGDSLMLNCSVQMPRGKSNNWPIVLWTRDGAPMDLSDRKKFTSVQHRLGPELLVFSLLIRAVHPSRDGGVYACGGPGLIRSSQIVNLVRSPLLASSSNGSPSPVPITLITIVILALISLI